MSKPDTNDWLSRNIQPGKKLKRFFQPGNINNATLYVRAIVDAEYVVTRQWSKTKSRWFYKVENIFMFELLYESGNLKVIE